MSDGEEKNRGHVGTQCTNPTLQRRAEQQTEWPTNSTSVTHPHCNEESAHPLAGTAWGSQALSPMDFAG